MASVPSTQQLTSQDQARLSSDSLVQLAFALNNLLNANKDAGSANDTRNVMSQNLTDRSNSVNSVADTYKALVQALQSKLVTTPGNDLEFLRNRSAQINSSLNSSIDRAGSQAMSSGFATALKRGMGNSTQAEDMATNLARKLSDVYVKADESAQQRAFDEMIKDRTVSAQTLGVAINGLVNANNTALSNARQLYDTAANTAKTANRGVGDNFGNVLSTSASKWLQGQADSYLKNNGGFSGVLDSLRKSFAGGSEAPAITMSGTPQRAFTGSEEDTAANGYWDFLPSQPTAQANDGWSSEWSQTPSGMFTLNEDQPTDYSSNDSEQSDLWDWWG